MTKGENPLTRRIPVKDRDGKVIGTKEVVGYRGLLDMVHKERLQVIRTKLLQAPSKENGETAIVHATVVTSRGTFTGIGDANPKNVNPKVAPHAIRMAETRAEARAMRKAVNSIRSGNTVPEARGPEAQIPGRRRRWDGNRRRSGRGGLSDGDRAG